ncbi:MAG: hypothetical protein LIO92_10315 [Clostridiales bacterium]|nr:hypothetical protein [Clostridiales bacterium]
MLMRKSEIALLMAVFLLGTAGSAAYAAEVPDLSQEGSITLTMTCETKTVAGGEMTLYQVGDILEDHGNYSFVLSEEFASSGIPLTDVSSSDTAAALSDYAAAQNLGGTTQPIRNDGTVTFESLKPGLYLLVQHQAASGYYAASPFLISVPLYDEAEDVYEYAVTATPKVEIRKKASGGGGSSHGGGSSSGGSTSGGSSSSGSGAGVPEDSGDTIASSVLTPFDSTSPELFKLPQTGQLNWPIPVMTLCGLLLFAFGWKLVFGGKRHLGQEA